MPKRIQTSTTPVTDRKTLICTILEDTDKGAQQKLYYNCISDTASLAQN